MRQSHLAFRAFLLPSLLPSVLPSVLLPPSSHPAPDFDGSGKCPSFFICDRIAVRDRQSLVCSEKTFPNNPKNIRLEDLFQSFTYANYFFSKRCPIHKGDYMLQFKCNAIRFMITAHVGDYYMPQFKCHARARQDTTVLGYFARLQRVSHIFWSSLGPIH